MQCIVSCTLISVPSIFSLSQPAITVSTYPVGFPCMPQTQALGSMVDVLYPNQLTGMSDFPHQEWIPPSTVGGLSDETRTTTQPPSLTPAMLWGTNSPTQASYDQVLYESPYSTPQISHLPEPLSLPNYTTILPRPKSSPGAFTHNADNFLFPSNPPRLKQVGVEDLTFSNSPLITARSPTPYYGNFSVPEINSAPKIKAPIPIAPDPVGLRKINALKRTRDDYDLSETLMKRRKRSDSTTATSISNAELSSEERLLLRLKDDENLPWKDIALRFQIELGKTYQVPALQMRYKRLREKLRVSTPSFYLIATYLLVFHQVWTDHDVR